MRATFPVPTEISPSDTQPETQIDLSPQRSTRRAALVHRLIARVLLGGLARQLFFAGLGVFSITTFLPHVFLGTGIVLASCWPRSHCRLSPGAGILDQLCCAGPGCWPDSCCSRGTD